MDIDNKIDFLSQLLMQIQDIYHIASAAILFLNVWNFHQESQMAFSLFLLTACQNARIISRTLPIAPGFASFMTGGFKP